MLNAKIIFENKNYIVADKPAGLLVYLPSGAAPKENLREQLAEKIFFNKDERSGIVHRLDKDTSGLVIVAKHEEAQEKLKSIFKYRKITKKYLALAEGEFDTEKGRIDIPLGRDAKNRLKVIPKGAGKQSVTEYRVLKYFPKSNLSLLEVDLKTGRMHQIRVHLAAIGHPIVGDQTYSKKKYELDRQFLHAAKLQFADPFNGEERTFESPLPVDLDIFLQNISG